MVDPKHLQAVGNCFEASLHTLVRSNIEDLTLIHALVSGTGHLEGIRFGHAWLEYRDANWIEWCWEVSNGNDVKVPKALYYRMGDIHEQEGEHYRYTREQAKDLGSCTGHCGPWELKSDY